MEIPILGLGTWKLFGEECTRVVKEALEMGYTHLDTAVVYENHKDIARAIQGYDREKLFITSKFRVEDISVADVEKICNLALKELRIEYLDLFLIHWPVRIKPLEAILEELYTLQEKGKIRSPGVSNYTKHHLQDAYDQNLDVPYNQVEFHPYLYQRDLLEFCQNHNTRLVAYRPFGQGRLVHEEPIFQKIGEKYHKTPAQVILRWVIQKNIPVIPKASSKKHLSENIDVFDFTLSEEEEKAIDRLNKNFRYCLGEDWAEFDY